MMEEEIPFLMISNVGFAKSCFIKSIQQSREKNFDEAQKLIEEGEGYFLEGHHVHTDLIQQEASTGDTNISLLLVHAEDQMTSAEVFRILSKEFLELYKERDQK